MNTKALIPLTILVMSLVFPLSVAQFAYAQTAFINLTVLKPVPGDVFYQGDDIAFMVQVTDDALNPVEGAHVNLQVWDPDGFPVAAVLGWTAQDGRIPVYASTLIPWGSEFPYKYNASEGQFGLRIKSNFNPGTYTYTVTATFTTGFPPETLTDFKTGSFVVQVFVAATGFQIIVDLIGSPASTLFEELAEVKANQEALSAQMALLETNVVDSIASVGTALLDEIQATSDSILAASDNILAVLDQFLLDFEIFTIALDRELKVIETISSEGMGAILAETAFIEDQIDLLGDAMLTSFESTIETVISASDAVIETVTSASDAVIETVTSGLEDVSGVVVATIGESTDAIKGSVVSSTAAILSTVESANGDLGSLLVESGQDLSTFLLAISVLLVITLLLAAVAAVRIVRLKSSA